MVINFLFIFKETAAVVADPANESSTKSPSSVDNSSILFISFSGFLLFLNWTAPSFAIPAKFISAQKSVNTSVGVSSPSICLSLSL